MIEETAFGLSELVLSSVVRITTHPRVFQQPSRIEESLAFCNALLEQPNAVRVAPGPRHWGIFCSLCEKVGAKGNLAADAYLAALAIESGAEWITTDRDFSRFPGLSWRHPLDRR
ncbi:MAG TPA: PIN domain-containing protein [Kiritimatiellia bacterium]|nr:PIN domain-containing protein [Kiritimatiellia bacterium]